MRGARQAGRRTGQEVVRLIADFGLRSGRQLLHHSIGLRREESEMKRLLFIAIALATSGCQTATTPGSAYRHTYRIADLVAEPTFDVGADPAAIYFYSFRVPHYDADGHGLFDIPMVFGEQLLFAPTWVFSNALRLTGGESYFDPRRPSAIGLARKTLGATRGAAAYFFAVPGTVCYFASLVSTMALDTAVHDVPVIVIGRPIRWLGQLAAGE